MPALAAQPSPTVDQLFRRLNLCGQTSENPQRANGHGSRLRDFLENGAQLGETEFIPSSVQGFGLSRMEATLKLWLRNDSQSVLGTLNSACSFASPEGILEGSYHFTLPYLVQPSIYAFNIDE